MPEPPGREWTPHVAVTGTQEIYRKDKTGENRTSAREHPQFSQRIRDLQALKVYTWSNAKKTGFAPLGSAI
jgi:hypothetical protein